MLIARSATECRLYIDLHPCSCGEVTFPVRHTLRPTASGGLDAVYEGICPRCALPRRFVFTLDPATPPPPPAYGGATASQIICPGEFALTADLFAGSAPADPVGLSPQQRQRGRAWLEQALAAEEEIAKFIPPGQDAVAPAAFTSDRGRVHYLRDPGRFHSDRLAAVARAYRESLAAYS